MSAEQELANAIANAVEVKLDNLRSESMTMPATYQGRDAQGKDWVLLPGATSPTPVSRMAVEAVSGDIVSVTIANGKATVDSNISNPSAGVAGVKVVENTANVAKDTADVAKSTAARAIDYASAAQSAADSAQSSANEAYKHADEAAQEAVNARVSAAEANAAAIAAVEDAGVAHTMAENATLNAEIAQSSALSARTSADTALFGLSEVENVVGVVNWIAEHGVYVVNEDEEVDPMRVYYTIEGGTYTLTDDSEIVPGKQYYTPSEWELSIIPSKLEWYELMSSITYSLTDDTAVDPGTQYYTYDPVTDEYSEVTPVGTENPSEEGWYVATVEYFYQQSADMAYNPSDTYYELSGGEYSVIVPSIDPNVVYYELDGTSFVMVSEPDVADIADYYSPTAYAPMRNPDPEDIGTYYTVSGESYSKVVEPVESDLGNYYVLDIDDSVQNYISTHLALLDDGLHVSGGVDDYSVVLSSDGMEVRNPYGKSVAMYGETARIGDADDIHLLAQATRMSFRSDAGDVAYIGMGDDEVWRLFIDQADVEDSIRFGNYVWVKRPNGNMTIKYVGGE